MTVSGGQEYFWMCRRVMSEYRIPQNDTDDVLAHAVYLAFIVPHPLSYSLIRWSVLMAIRIHCGIRKYTLVPFHTLDDSWVVFQPEVEDNNVVNLEKFRTLKNPATLSIQSGQ